MAMLMERPPTALRQLAARLLSLREQRAADNGPSLIRLREDVGDLDPLAWLAAQPDPQQVYWRDRSGDFEMAGIGVADVLRQDGQADYEELFATLAERLESAAPELRYYGGASFPGQQGREPGWQRMGACRFVLPQFELCREAGRSHLACNLALRSPANVEAQCQQASARLEQLAWPAAGSPAPPPPPLERTDCPTRAEWQDTIAKALAMLETGPLEKVVLVRRSDLRFARPPRPTDLLRRWRQAAPDCFHFCFQPEDALAFLGASPELLYRREDRAIATEAVAGTRPRGDSPEAEEAYARALLESEKDLREHRYVMDSLQRALHSLCDQVRAEAQPSLLRLPQAQHLQQALSGCLRPELGDARIVQCLHPTPAVGGEPRQLALAQIESLEPFARGWYASPVGWVGRRAATFAVAIRCGLLKAERLGVYAGAGIVVGSTPQDEWDELETKLAGFLQAFNP